MVSGIMGLTTIHHSAAAVAADGKDADVEGLSGLVLYVNRPGGTSTVKFLGSPNGIDFIDIQGVNLTTMTLATNTTGGDASVGAFTVVAATGIATLAGHGLLSNYPVRFNSADTLPAPLAVGVTYYVKVLSVDTFTIHTAAPVSDANKVTLTNTGVGVHTAYKGGEVWSFDVNGFKTFRAKLDAVSGSKVSAYSYAKV